MLRLGFARHGRDDQLLAPSYDALPSNRAGIFFVLLHIAQGDHRQNQRRCQPGWPARQKDMMPMTLTTVFEAIVQGRNLATLFMAQA